MKLYKNYKVSPIYSDIVTNSAYNSQQCVEIYKNHFRDLEFQIQEKQRKKIDEKLNKQKETKERLQKIYVIRDLEYQDLEKNEFLRIVVNGKYLHRTPCFC